MANPFEKGAGDKPGMHRNEEPPPASICPFLGGVAIPMLDEKASLIANPKANPLDSIQMGITYSVCQQSRCALWHVQAQACSLKVAAFAQIKMSQDLAVLLKRIGG